MTLTDERGIGLLGQASILTVTSYAHRTSVVLRGKWVLENLLGAPPPPPPPNVPPLKENDGKSQADVAARAHGAAPREPGLRELPRADGPARLRARELRRDRQVARERQRRRRSTRPSRCRRHERSTARRRSARRCSAARHGREFVRTVAEKLLDLRARPRRRIRRSADRPAARARSRPGTTTAGRRSMLRHRDAARRSRCAGRRTRDRRPAATTRRAGAAKPRSLSGGVGSMFITKMHLSRRTMLRGLGASLALPLLDSMVPALTALAGTRRGAGARASACSTCRTACRCRTGSRRPKGRCQQLPPTLQSLQSSRTGCCSVGGLGDESANQVKGRRRSRALGRHVPDLRARSSSPRRRRVRRAVSMDQIAAKQFAKETQLASLELGIESNAMLGSCDGGSSCALHQHHRVAQPDDAAAASRTTRAPSSSGCSAPAAAPTPVGAPRADQARPQHSRFRRRDSRRARESDRPAATR